MGTKENLLSELGFLDEANVVLDENPKQDGSDNNKPIRNEEVPEMNLDKTLLKAIDGMSNEAALAVIRAVKKIPASIKKAVGAVYEAVGELGIATSTDDVKKSLTDLKKECGKKYVKIYDKTVKDVKKRVQKIQARLFSDGIS